MSALHNNRRGSAREEAAHEELQLAAVALLVHASVIDGLLTRRRPKD